jgi:tetratricopeptide (TPR) repeat protein
MISNPPNSKISNPPNPKIIEANSFIEKDDLPEARKVLEDAINSGEEYAFIYLALGDICNALIANPDAKLYYEKAIEFSYKDNDNQVRVAAKSGLARVYFQDAMNDFDALPTVEKTEELKEIFSSVTGKKIFPAALFMGSPCDCITSGGLEGRWVFDALNPPTYMSCRRCRVSS